MQPEIVTIGVYGFEREAFFQALLDAHVTIFCDLRARRSVRGSEYTFANSTRLQQSLQEIGIRYVHRKDLAPSAELRAVQAEEDKHEHIARRKRSVLSQRFIQLYGQEYLSHFDSRLFITQIHGETGTICLFCVEREPDACHRSLVAHRLEQDLGLHVTHIR
ncbi:MAG: DUF488 domain-containing protein [Ktedonobacteraceae bacterium]|nr:DUF488 domain-containing protein [Ktedonobacteraceae bacterium]